jgi:hypothetical protein
MGNKLERPTAFELTFQNQARSKLLLLFNLNFNIHAEFKRLGQEKPNLNTALLQNNVEGSHSNFY